MGNLIFNSKDSMQNLIKLVNEAAEAVGKVFGGGKGTGAFVLAAPVAALIVSGVADYIDDKQQKQIQAEKERLQKEAISKQAALIQALRDDAQMSRERQDYLECLNQQLQKAFQMNMALMRNTSSQSIRSSVCSGIQITVNGLRL